MSAALPSAGNKPKAAGQQQRVLLAPGVLLGGQDQALIPGSKQESPPAAAVRPFTPQPSKDALLPPFRKPQTVAASSIYSMYTQHPAPGKNFQQAVQSALTKSHPRGPPFPSGKVLGHLLTCVGGAGPTPELCSVGKPNDSSLCSKGFVYLWLLVFIGSLNIECRLNINHCSGHQ